MGRILGRSVRYEQATAEQYVQSLVRAGASSECARSRVEMHAELAQGIAHAEPRTPESTTRTTLAKWGARELLPIVQSLLAKSAFREFSGLLELGEVWPQEAASQRMHLGD